MIWEYLHFRNHSISVIYLDQWHTTMNLPIATGSFCAKLLGNANCALQLKVVTLFAFTCSHVYLAHFNRKQLSWINHQSPYIPMLLGVVLCYDTRGSWPEAWWVTTPAEMGTEWLTTGFRVPCRLIEDIVALSPFVLWTFTFCVGCWTPSEYWLINPQWFLQDGAPKIAKSRCKWLSYAL